MRPGQPSRPGLRGARSCADACAHSASITFRSATAAAYLMVLFVDRGPYYAAVRPVRDRKPVPAALSEENRMKLRLALSAAARIIAAAGVAMPASAAVTVDSAAYKSATSAAITPNGAWTTYHHDNSRAGYDSTAAPAISATAGWVSPVLDGPIYGEPLVYQGIVYAS